MKSSSFVRRGAAVKREPGTLPGPYGQSLVSTGLVDLDQLLGGGLPLGCLLLVIEDSPPETAATLLRYFLAEGVAAGHACCWAAPAGESDDQLWLPQQAAQPRQQRQQEPAAVDGVRGHPQNAAAAGSAEARPQQEDHLRIAWQYRRYMGGRADAAHAPHPRQHNGHARDTAAVPVVTASAKPVTLGWCHSFDLSRPQTVAEAAPALDVRRHSRAADVATFAASPPAPAASIGRIAVQSLGRSSAAGGSHSTDVAASPAASGDRGCAGGAAEQGADARPHGAAEAAGLVRAVHALKCATRRSRCVALVTLPAGDFEPALAVRLQHMADAVLVLEAIPRDAQLLQILPEPDTCRGMLRVVKLPGVGALVAPHPEMDLLLVRRLPRRLALQPVDVDPDAADALLEAQQGDAGAGDVKDVQDDLDDDESDSVDTIGIGTGVSGAGMLCGGGGRQGGTPNPLDF